MFVCEMCMCLRGDVFVWEKCLCERCVRCAVFVCEACEMCLCMRSVCV